MAVDADLHDLRSAAAEPVAALDPVSYAASQALARALRGAGSDGIAYSSVRHPGGGCVALFYRTVLQISFRGGTSIIIGTERALTLCEILGVAQSFVWSTCPPVRPNRFKPVTVRCTSDNPG